MLLEKVKGNDMFLLLAMTQAHPAHEAAESHYRTAPRPGQAARD
jgi:hypothetical protein